MDILGIGAAEILIIALLTMIVAGPKRTAEWARQAGVYVRQLRDLWGRMMADLRKEMGDDADEFVKTTREISNTVSEFRQQTSIRNVAGKAINAAQKMPASNGRDNSNETTTADSNGSTENSRYDAWVKPDSDAE